MGTHGYGDYDCNCQAQDVDVYDCQLRITVCFYFKDAGHVESGSVVYKATAYDANNQDHTGSANGYDDPTECGTAASDASKQQAMLL